MQPRPGELLPVNWRRWLEWQVLRREKDTLANEQGR
jgi:hypothetical protein